MAKRRDWFTAPLQGGFYIVDTAVNRIGFNDASRPYVVMERYYGGYQYGMRTIPRGYYADLDAAKRRIRYCESNG